MGKKIRVLVVDDSAVVRQTMTQLLESDPDISVMGAVNDPYAAARALKEERPDVITLDVEMPLMDGLTFLQKIMSQHPIPTVMCSSLTGSGCEAGIRALEYGAVDIITKPQVNVKQFLEESRIRICDSVKAAAQARISRRSFKPAREKLTADAVMAKPTGSKMFSTTEKVIIMGASTGGTEALRKVLTSMPHNAPGIAVVQHMPEKFTEQFAYRLDTECSMTVKEARNGDALLPGVVLIAPGNKHMLLKRSGARYHVEIQDGPLVSRHRPSVDVLFRSAARYAGKNAVGVILTGMGDDGANGMLEMKQAGATTIAQDEKTCVVFGMPKEAIERGGVDHICPLDHVARKTLEACDAKAVGAGT